MPEKATTERAKNDLREGKSPSTAAGEFVHEEIEHIREGKHGARSPQQALRSDLPPTPAPPQVPERLPATPRTPPDPLPTAPVPGRPAAMPLAPPPSAPPLVAAPEDVAPTERLPRPPTPRSRP